MIRLLLALTIALTATAAFAGTVSPTVTVDSDSVVVTAGDQCLTIRLADAGLELKTPYRSYSFSPSLMQGEGWVRPTRPAAKPKVERRRGSVHVELDYPIIGDRALALEVDAYDGIAAVFITSRLRVIAGTRAEYYFWGWEGTFRHYYAASATGPEHKEVDTTKSFSRLGYKDWFFLPSANGGLMISSKGDIGRGEGEKGEPFLWAMIRGRALGVGESMDAGFGVAGVKDQNEACRLWQSIAKRNVPALQRTPELKRLAGIDYGKPAPEWLRNAEIYNGFYKTRVDWNRKNISNLLNRVPLIVGVPHDKAIIDLCHRAGIRVIPYVNYMELLNTEVEAKARGSVYYEWTQSVDHNELDLVNHPDWIAYDSGGKEIKSIWGSQNGHPGLYYTCFHQKSMQDVALGQVRKLMEMGADGVFIDNAGPVQDCAGDKSGKHEHPDPSKTNTQMYEVLQQRIYDLVKSFGPDKIVMHNSGVIASHWPYCDTQMWESCTYGAGAKDRIDEWEELRYRGEELAEAVGHGKIPVILSYFDAQPADKRFDCALYTYAYARLYGILWADWFTLAGYGQSRDAALSLYSLRLGKPTGGVTRQGQVFCRVFERGVVLLNPSKTAQAATVSAPDGVVVNSIGYDAIERSANGRVLVRVRPESGALLYWDRAQIP